MVQNAQREEREEPVLDVVLNRIFLGNPGTGKTAERTGLAEPPCLSGDGPILR